MRPTLPPIHRRWILVHALALAAVTNLVINGTIAWLVTIGRRGVPLWTTPLAGPSLIIDTSLTLFLLPLFACPLITASVWSKRRRGALPPLPAGAGIRPLGAWLPHRNVLRGIAFGAYALMLFAPLAVGVLVAIDLRRVSDMKFIVYKALLAVAVGAIVTPVAALCAMADRLDRA